MQAAKSREEQSERSLTQPHSLLHIENKQFSCPHARTPCESLPLLRQTPSNRQTLPRRQSTNEKGHSRQRKLRAEGSPALVCRCQWTPTALPAAKGRSQVPRSVSNKAHVGPACDVLLKNPFRDVLPGCAESINLVSRGLIVLRNMKIDPNSGHAGGVLRKR